MSIFIEVMMTQAVLRKWIRTPLAAKRDYHFVSGWQTDDPDNDKPIPDELIESNKAFLKKHNPSGFDELFPEDRG